MGMVLPSVGVGLMKPRNSMFGPCVRYGNMKWTEKHPCYICGYPIPVTLKYCKCGIIKCPKCGACACESSMSKEVFSALIKLRNKYCCNPINFAKGIDFDQFGSNDEDLLKLVPHYKTAFNYCRNLEIKSAERLNRG